MLHNFHGLVGRVHSNPNDFQSFLYYALFIREPKQMHIQSGTSYLWPELQSNGLGLSRCYSLACLEHLNMMNVGRLYQRYRHVSVECSLAG